MSYVGVHRIDLYADHLALLSDQRYAADGVCHNGDYSFGL